ncbi:aminotransferase class I/II-fold pyridoxal phosphate-dependent enzyme, partial [Mycobacterium sp.]|jgi:dTDP-4-amino-4,6-dideoxygalactose transaminase|uniref:aminotransferase class I/II-fold pyridoxal phosphate-dependent enzyme n=1 Tax=Mycobacterium sp. TaxID=1785 RepID=UPI003BB01DE9
MTTRIYLSPPHMGGDEAGLVADAIASNWIAPLGPYIDEFERMATAQVDGLHAVALSSGTAALHLALILAGVERGQDVLLPTLTFAATANAVAYVGARPVFIDAAAGSWQLDPALLEDELARRARNGNSPAAVITVDLYGQCCDYERIEAACNSYEVPMIEDAAEALGATYRGRAAGSFGMMSTLSFNGNKIITTSGGGMLLSRDKQLADRARFLATQAREAEAHYEHREIGYNYRMSNLLAAVGVGQLRVLGEHKARRQDHNRFYREHLGQLPGVEFMPDSGQGESSWWLTCLTVDSAVAGTSSATIREHLLDLGIESRPVWKPMHLQPVFENSEAVGGGIAERLFSTGLCLPSGSNLTDTERDEVASEVRRCFT